MRVPNTASSSVSSITVSGVGAGRRTGGTTRAIAEHVAAEERVEQIVEPELARAEPLARAGAIFGSEHLVAATAFGIAQRLVRLVDLLEAILSRGIVVVGVGMMITGKRAVRLLDLVFGRVA